jgi:chaperonin cofactor prefoldin
MQGKKNNPKLQILFAAMFLALVFVMELYAMINMQNEFLIIGVLGFVFLACIYMLIRAILMLQAEKEARREEQYENIFKSEKASFLMLKKHFESIEEKLDVIEEISKLPTDEIVGTQKAIGKVIINRNRENAEAIINSNEGLLDSFGNLQDSIDKNNEKLLASYKSISEENMQQMTAKQQEFFMGIKDMEIRLSNAIIQSQNMAAQAAPVYASPMMEAGMTEAPTVSGTEMDRTENPADAGMEDVLSMEEEPVANAEEPVNVAMEDTASMAEEPDVNAEEPADEAVEAALRMAEESAANIEVPAEEPVVEADDFGQTQETAPERNQEILEPAVETPVKEAPAVDMSNPNKQLGADEIESLFASISQEATENVPEPEPAEEKAEPSIDLSDPNKRMSADEIAALFSSMGA